MKRHLAYTAVVMILTGCGYDSFDDFTPDQGKVVVPNTDILFVRTLCGDGVYNVTDDMILGGWVTANDKSGNIHRSFFIEDATGAAEIRAGMYSLHNVYTRGRYISVRLQGLAVTLDNGVLRVGVPPSQGYTGVEYIDSWAVAAEYIFSSDEIRKAEALPLVVAQLHEAHCGRLVKLDNMRFVNDNSDDTAEDGDEKQDTTGSGFISDEVVTWAFPRDEYTAVPQSAYRYFEDIEGNTVAVHTSGYAGFAGREVPRERISITGILGYGNTDSGQMFILRLRDEDDIAIQVN